MSFFKKLFGTKDSPPPETINVSADIKTIADVKPVVSATKVSFDSLQANNIELELSSAKRFICLDDDFIELIYFSDDKAKQKHRDNINLVLSKLKIKPGTDFHEIQKILFDYDYMDLDEPIPFLTESLLFENFDIKTDANGVTETKSTLVAKGAEKIHDYYSAASFISENIKLKLNSQQTDFSFEENLYNTNVANSDLNNFAKLNSTFSLGLAFFKVNKISKAEQYFERLEKGPFDLQPSTIAGFYRNIGELYADNGNKEKALKWLKGGLKLNPKLGVK